MLSPVQVLETRPCRCCPSKILLNELLYGASQLATRPIGWIPSSCARRRTKTCT